MGRGVRWIGELAGDPALGGARRELLGSGDRALHALGARGEHEFGAIGGEKGPPFGAHRLRHGYHESVSARRRQGCQADTGVSARRLDDGVAGVRRDGAGGRRLVQHVEGDAVFDRACGVLALELHEHARLEVELALESDEFKQGRVAHELVEGGVDAGHIYSFARCR